MLKPGRLVPPDTCMLHVCYMYVVIGRYMYMYMYMIGSYMYVVIKPSWSAYYIVITESNLQNATQYSLCKLATFPTLAK